MEGLRGRWLSARSQPGTTPVTATFSGDGSAGSASTSSSVEEVSKSGSSPPSRPPSIRGASDPARPPSRGSGLRPLSLSMSAAPPVPQPPPPPVPEPGRFSGWVGSFFSARPASSRASTASSTRRESSSAASVTESSRGPSPHPVSPPTNARDSVSNASIVESVESDMAQPRNLDDVHGGIGTQEHGHDAQETEPAGTGVAL